LALKSHGRSKVVVGKDFLSYVTVTIGQGWTILKKDQSENMVTLIWQLEVMGGQKSWWEMKSPTWLPMRCLYLGYDAAFEESCQKIMWSWGALYRSSNVKGHGG
jgi:hypothetical protein